MTPGGANGFPGGPVGSTPLERLASLDRWSIDHDRRCAERSEEFKSSIKDLQSDIDIMSARMEKSAKFTNRTVLGILLALIAWGGKEMWYARGGVVAGVGTYIAAAHDPERK